MDNNKEKLESIKRTAVIKKIQPEKAEIGFIVNLNS